jgi:hypothetical protein
MSALIKNILAIAGLTCLLSCEIAKPQLMNYLGDVILIRGCEVCVSFDNVNEDYGNKSLGCFAHLNGHGYQVGDRYPQAEKQSTGRAIDCQQDATWNDRIKNEIIHNPKPKN